MGLPFLPLEPQPDPLSFPVQRVPPNTLTQGNALYQRCQSGPMIVGSPGQTVNRTNQKMQVGHRRTEFSIQHCVPTGENPWAQEWQHRQWLLVPAALGSLDWRILAPIPTELFVAAPGTPVPWVQAPAGPKGGMPRNESK